MKFTMDKPQYNKAFTLLEMLLVLCVISVFLFVISSPKKLEILKIKSLFQQAQIQAMATKSKVDVYIENNHLQINQRYYELKYHCGSHYFWYNEEGNISNALTVNCDTYKIILQLGSGQIEIKQ